MITVDLRAAVVPQTTKVWRLFPGSDYRFLKTFLDEGVGFLDLPAFILPSPPLAASRELLGRILASSRTKEMIATSGSDVDPIVDWQQFSRARRTANRGRIEQAV